MLEIGPTYKYPTYRTLANLDPFQRAGNLPLARIAWIVARLPEAGPLTIGMVGK